MRVYIYSTVDVDISSCIISLTDLYTHWLTQPIHSLLLHHVLMSIVMLSDLFALVREEINVLLDVYYNYLLHAPVSLVSLIGC